MRGLPEVYEEPAHLRALHDDAASDGGSDNDSNASSELLDFDDEDVMADLDAGL